MDINADILKEINRFTRRELKADEVYVFDVILCDNEIDRDGEAFSVEALDSLREAFVGKTGIFDHNPKGTNQTARIFSTSLERETGRKTKSGEGYVCLRAGAYMVKTAENAGLIAEIDGGIKKEVSVSCACSVRRCSICGTNKREKSCQHMRGEKYAGKTCFCRLEGVTDAYEWSFVAIPAQPAAGVTKRWNGESEDPRRAEVIAVCADILREDIVRMSFEQCPASVRPLFDEALKGMELSRLAALRHELSVSAEAATRQLAPKRNGGVSGFKL